MCWTNRGPPVISTTPNKIRKKDRELKTITTFNYIESFATSFNYRYSLDEDKNLQDGLSFIESTPITHIAS